LSALVIGQASREPFRAAATGLALGLLAIGLVLNGIGLWRDGAAYRRGDVRGVIFTRCFLLQFAGFILRIVAGNLTDSAWRTVIGTAGTLAIVGATVLMIVQLAQHYST